MSVARVLARIGAFFLVLAAVMFGYNYAARSVVERALSEAKNSPPLFETRPIETSFDLKEFKGFGDDFLYKPERGRFGNR